MRSTARGRAAAACLVPAACLALAACGGEEASSGVTEVTASGTGWRLERTAAVGGADAPAEQTLFGVIGVTEDAGGNFWVLNQGDKRILAFDSTGKFLRAIGRTGNGPGEFSAPVSVAARGSDGLFVLDAVHGRLNRFRRSDGAYLGEATVKQDGFALRRMDVTPDGQVFVEAARPQVLTGSRNTQPFVARVDTLTGAYTPVLTLDTVSKVQFTRKSPNGPGSLIMEADRPFSPKPVWTVDRQGNVVYGTGRTFEVFRTAGAGQPPSVVVRGQGEPQPVTDEDRETYLATARRMGAGDGKDIDFPESKPFFNDLRVDDEGRVWVQTPRAGGVRAWRVYAPDGTPQGEVLLPEGTFLRGISRGAVYILRKDEDDVETLERWRIVR